MCTAATYMTKNVYFGRNFDYDISYNEEVTIIPRNFPFKFREVNSLDTHYAIIGIACVADNYPLLYDGINEKGLGGAGLNFSGNAVYNDHVDGKDNVAQFEFLNWILGQCATVAEAKVLLAKMNFRNLNFSEQLPATDLHWIFADATGAAITVESMTNGLNVYDNPVGILTNNPPFDKMLLQLSNYQHLSAKAPVNNLAPNLNLPVYSRGMGAIGLPGDLSSESRFAKAAFTKLNSLSESDEVSSVNQFFHILHSVDQQHGCCDLGDGHYEYTIYSDCYDLGTGSFYYTTYKNHQITAYSLANTNLDSTELFHTPIINAEQINYQN